MTPTMKLRWVPKSAMYTVGVTDADIGGRYVLQQWWQDAPTGIITTIYGIPIIDEAPGEWRDIPIEAEE